MKKVLASLVFSLLISIGFISTETEAATYRAGDIIITKSTSAKGIVGHAGIFISPTVILHTSGKSVDPYPTTITVSTWNSRYPQSKVIRPNSATLGANAAAQAKAAFDGKKIPYAITPNPKNINYTYCSEIVWYSYYKAGKEFKIVKTSVTPDIIMNPDIPAPYDFIDATQVSWNGFSFIDNSW